MLIDEINLKTSSTVSELNEYTAGGIPTAAFGVSKPLKYALCGALFSKALYICRDSLSAKEACDELTHLTGKKAVYLPAKDDVLLFKRAFVKDNYYNRLNALYEIFSGKAYYITTTLEAILSLVPEKIESLDFSVSNSYSMEYLIKKLVQMGYTRNEFVTNKGEFAVRGDIFEVFPINSDVAFRCEFFGDDIEIVRYYDVATRTALEDAHSFKLISAIDFQISESEVEHLKVTIKKEVKNIVPIAKQRASRLANDLIEIIDSNPNDIALTFLLPLLKCAKRSFISILSNDYVVAFDEPKLINDSFINFYKSYAERCASLLRSGDVLKFAYNQFFQVDDFIYSLKDKRLLSFQNVTTIVPFFNPLKTVRFSCGTIARYSLKYEELESDLKAWKHTGYRVIICCGSIERAKRLYDGLTDKGIFAEMNDYPQKLPGVYVTSHYLGGGFILHDNKLAVIGTTDLFVAIKKKTSVRRRNETFEAPTIGDYAVHEKYGIGIVRGVERISTTEGAKDYVSVEYSGGDFLYVPVDDVDRLTKYLGGGSSPQLNKIGGGEFERIKQRVRESISSMSINLKKLYKERNTLNGFKFSPDNELSEEFDNAFEFEPTEDQIRSIDEIKHDMESEKVMDRLLCGDVGYGKTEVALRAAFKAVLDMKQVALLAPTTILTEQHFNTCIERFKNFGVKVGVLNRFRKPIQIKDTLKRLASGDIDIVVGTHRLLNKDVVFKDLGLLILDEEQCFGVEHKEKLRLMKKNVDTLTMTATPIPRTLHMSLTGIRDISLINTPPVSRIPVQAYVTEESDALIRDAVVRELAREGQVFILYNKVESISTFANHIQTIVPEAKVIYGHGQMSRETLENSILSFYRGDYNVLVCTTIIENGIDLPSANTLIVTDADNLGLFTLYQLKGRVGRSDKMAYAYFTYKEGKVLSENAYKRLSALMEHTDLGSGYKIAMRDLEIRGAGNVLGREQHGHMDKIGYELYSKLLREQLGEVEKDFDTELDVRIDAYIPDDYIVVDSSRLDAYKSISEIASEEDAREVIKKIIENYGQMPDKMYNLVKIALVKRLARKLEVTKVTITKNTAILYFKDLNSISGGVQIALQEQKSAVLSFGTTPLVTFTKTSFEDEMLSVVYDFLIISLKNQKIN